MPAIKVMRSRVASLGGALRLLAVVLGAVMFAAAAVGTLHEARTSTLRDLDRALASDVAANSAALDEYFDRARTVDLLLAHDSVFTDLAPGSRPAALTASAAVGAREATRAMAYLEALYPGRISEACLIDSSGTEIARVVDGTAAVNADLSTTEASAPFFAPTLALPQDRVYQSAPYVSEDTHRWVISNSTPLRTGSAPAWGLVHFEVALASFQPANRSGAARGRSVSVVDASTGEVVLRDGVVVLDDVTGRGPAAPALLRPLLSSQRVAFATVDGRRQAVVHLPAAPDNASSWAVVVAEPVLAEGFWRSVGAAPVAMAAAALMLLTIAGLSLRSSHRSLRAASLTDELTGLPNRRLVGDRLDQALVLSRRRGTACGVLLIDLDRFKEVNDTLGHHYGDELLRCVADRLSIVFRESDTVSRLGGDEFAVLLQEIDGEQAALALARRCLQALHQEFLVEGVALSVEASIGVAIAPAHGREAGALMRAADVAMYDAKASKHGVVVYDPELDINTPSRLALLGDLRAALLHDQLVLHYQPKVDLETGRVRGVEALVRWMHPERGLIPPSDFIPVAEGTGLILPLTVRTLEIAVAQARAWVQAGRPVQIAVNLSPRCLLEPDFAADVIALLQREGLPAHLLRLEITESTIMADPAKALSVLSELQTSGISLSIDDFGTGYSSMSYLKRLPVDELKIDRSFVMDMLANGSDSVLVRSSIDLGHNLGLSVVAEGVEDQETVEALAALGCDVLQGFHLARPMDAAAATAWLVARPRPGSTAASATAPGSPPQEAAGSSVAAGSSQAAPGRPAH